MIFSNSNTDILPGIIRHFETSFDQDELTLELPMQLREMELQVNGLEIVKSNTI